MKKHLLLLIAFGNLFLETTLAQKLPDLIPYRKGNKWGYCDSTKKIIIPCKYEEANFFEHGLGKIKLNGKYGMINGKGKIIIKPKYSSLEFNNINLIVAGIDNTLKLKHKHFTSYDKWCRALDRINAHDDDQLFGLYDTTGKLLLKPKNLSIKPFSEGFAAVHIEHSKCIFINTKGKNKFNKEFPIRGYSEHDKICLINAKGLNKFKEKFRKRPLIAGNDQYLDEQDGMFRVIDYSFHEGLLSIILEDGPFQWDRYTKYGFIDTMGTVVIQANYFGVPSRFANGIAPVYVCPIPSYGSPFIDSCSVWINKKAEIIEHPDENAMLNYNSTIWGEPNKKQDNANLTVKKTNDIRSRIFVTYDTDKKVHYGLKDSTGKIIIPSSMYDMVDPLGNKFIRVVRGDKTGVCNVLGEILIPLKYNSILLLPNNLLLVTLAYNKINPDSLCPSNATNCAAVIDINQKEIIPFNKYAGFEYWNDSTFLVKRFNGSTFSQNTPGYDVYFLNINSGKEIFKYRNMNQVALKDLYCYPKDLYPLYRLYVESIMGITVVRGYMSYSGTCYFDE